MLVILVCASLRLIRCHLIITKSRCVVCVELKYEELNFGSGLVGSLERQAFVKSAAEYYHEANS